MFTCALSIAGTKKHPHDPDVLEYKVGRRAGQEVWQLHDVAKDKAILHQKSSGADRPWSSDDDSGYSDVQIN